MDYSARSAFDGPTLLQEQADMLAQSQPADINYLQYLRLKLSAQQKATAQRNQHQRSSGGEEHSTARNSASGYPNPCDAPSPIPGHPVKRENSIDGSGMYPTESTNSSRKPWETPPQALPLSRNAGEDTGSAGRGGRPSGAGNSSVNPLDDMPASVAKRRSMGEPQAAAASSYDETPAVASRDKGMLGGVPEHPTEAVALEKCPHCGRTFAPGRLEKHEDMCKRQQERELDLLRRKPTNRTAPLRSSVAGSVTSTSVDSRKGSLVQSRRLPMTGAKTAATANGQAGEYDEL